MKKVLSSQIGKVVMTFSPIVVSHLITNNLTISLLNVALYLAVSAIIAYIIWPLSDKFFGYLIKRQN